MVPSVLLIPGGKEEYMGTDSGGFMPVGRCGSSDLPIFSVNN